MIIAATTSRQPVPPHSDESRVVRQKITSSRVRSRAGIISVVLALFVFLVILPTPMLAQIPPPPGGNGELNYQCYDSNFHTPLSIGLELVGVVLNEEEQP